MNDSSFNKTLDNMLWLFLLFYFCTCTVIGVVVTTYATFKYFLGGL